MEPNRFDEHAARRLTLEEGALGWCQYRDEKPEHGYLVIGRLRDGSVRALDRRGWNALRRRGELVTLR